MAQEATSTYRTTDRATPGIEGGESRKSKSGLNLFYLINTDAANNNMVLFRHGSCINIYLNDNILFLQHRYITKYKSDSLNIADALF